MTEYNWKKFVKPCPDESCKGSAHTIHKLHQGQFGKIPNVDYIMVACFDCGHATCGYRASEFGIYGAEEKALDEWNKEPWTVKNGIRKVPVIDALPSRRRGRPPNSTMKTDNISGITTQDIFTFPWRQKNIRPKAKEAR